MAEAQVDSSSAGGYFVRLDVEVESFDGRFVGPGHLAWLALSDGDAERLAAGSSTGQLA